MTRSPARALAFGAVAALLLALAAAFAPTAGPAAAAGTISIRLHNCAATYDGANATIYDLAANCHDPGAGLTVALSRDNTPVSTMTADANGAVNFANFQATAEAELTESAPLGFYNRAFCALYLDNDATAHVYYQYQDPVLQPIKTGQNFDCDFFNIAYVPANPTTVYVNKHNCPVGFDALGADIYGLAGGCTAGGTDGVAFTLTGPANASTPATTSGGIASWPNVAVGAITLTETIPSGYASVRVFCNTKNASGDETGFSEYPATNGAISATTKSGYDFYCDWFDIPPATVTVTITKYNCPANTSDHTNFASMLQLCAVYPGVTFDLTAGAATTSTPMTTDAQGGAQWTGLAPSDYHLREEPPDGFGAPSVACKIGVSSASPPASVMDASQNNTIDFTLTAGQTAECIWFNFPLPPTPAPTATATSTPAPIVIANTPSSTSTPVPTAVIKARLIIFAFTCPAGYDVLKANANPTADCTDTAKDAPFTLTGAGIAPINHTIGGQDNTDFAPLDAGNYELTETFPAGVASAFIDHCTSDRDFSSYPFTPFARVGASGKVALNIRDGEKLMCVWFNVPGQKTATAGATVKITVRDCPGQSVNLSQCTPGASGVQFTLTPVGTQGTAATLATDATGVASGPVNAGTYKIAETGGNWCLADSAAFDTNANLVVAGDNVEVAIYHCGP